MSELYENSACKCLCHESENNKVFIHGCEKCKSEHGAERQGMVM